MTLIHATYITYMTVLDGGLATKEAYLVLHMKATTIKVSFSAYILVEFIFIIFFPNSGERHGSNPGDTGVEWTHFDNEKTVHVERPGLLNCLICV